MAECKNCGGFACLGKCVSQKLPNNCDMKAQDRKAAEAQGRAAWEARALFCYGENWKQYKNDREFLHEEHAFLIGYHAALQHERERTRELREALRDLFQNAIYRSDSNGYHQRVWDALKLTESEGGGR